MAFNKLAYLVLPYRPSSNFLCKIPNNITSRRHCPICKVVNSINKNLLLLNSKALVLERVGVSPGLSKAPNASRNSRTRTFEVLSCLGVISELSSLDCSNCLVNTSWFVDSSHVYGGGGGGGISVLLGGACFWAGLRLRPYALQPF